MIWKKGWNEIRIIRFVRLRSGQSLKALGRLKFIYFDFFPSYFVKSTFLHACPHSEKVHYFHKYSVEKYYKMPSRSKNFVKSTKYLVIDYLVKTLFWRKNANSDEKHVDFSVEKLNLIPLILLMLDFLSLGE